MSSQNCEVLRPFLKFAVYIRFLTFSEALWESLKSTEANFFKLLGRRGGADQAMDCTAVTPFLVECHLIASVSHSPYSLSPQQSLF